MKTIVMLIIAALLSVFAWIVALEQIRPHGIAATVSTKEKVQKNCDLHATVKAYRSVSEGTVCSYLLEVDNGQFIYPLDLPAGFQLSEGTRITVNYKVTARASFLPDCIVTDQPVYSARINCISITN